ncbi:hypothetical protein E2562_026397 [Oryza meyeriana var. granulata]|uniref:Large ribosomal subunit protein uL4c n=1 Tax=Oryza meyeriana var. granulata TaxID=110450 RepID=A0A6G1DNJ3_9ORYZ|nr:hypothetical protein E2562_026397 [Oryza meyeriana var. granulata]
MSDALINGVAGAGGGIIAQLITYPLQTVNARQQTERDPSKPAFKDGAVRQMCLVVKHEGWERLYGGLMPSLVGTAASQGVYYYFYQIFRSRAEAAALQRSRKGVGDGSVGMLQSLTVAALSGCVNVLLTNPIWVVVTRMQTHRKASKQQSPLDLTCVLDKTLEPPTVENIPHKTIHVIQDLYKEAGLLGFWKWVVPTLIMVSNPAIQFMLYETLLKKLKKKRVSNLKGADGMTALEIFLLGAVAKLGATAVTYPLLVVKARLQAKQIIGDDKRHCYKGGTGEGRKAAAVSVLCALRAEAATLPVLSFSGEKVGEVALDLKSSPPSTARAVVHRALITDRQNKRRGTASTLTRGEVSEGGRKPYQQKKTGKARRGSMRTPLRPGGGVIFGPKPRDWSIKINRKEKRLAISTALASAAVADDAFVVEEFDEEFAAGPKTRDFVAALQRWGLDPKQKAMFFATEFADNVRLSGRNIGSLKMLTPRTLNLYDILDARKLFFTAAAIDYLNSRYGATVFDEYEDDTDGEDDGEEEAEEVQEEETSAEEAAQVY